MKHLTSDSFPPEYKGLVYNAMDGLLTYEILDVLKGLVPDDAQRIYTFEKKLLGPILSMSRRGIRIDEAKRTELINNLWPRIRALTGMDVKIKKNGDRKWYVANKEAIFQRLAFAMWGKELNPNSGKQLREFFYGFMGLSEVTRSKKGVLKVMMDRDAQEKLHKQYVKARPFTSCLLRFTDIKKQLELLETPLLDGRFMYTFNPSGTNEGRFNSKANPLYIGHNIQNIDPDLRHIFIPDDDFIFVSADLQGADTWGVAYLSGDEELIKLVQSGDPHTPIAAMAWGFEPKRELADRKFYQTWTYRDMAKRLGHGTNFYGKAKTIAAEIKVETSLVEIFQRKYFKRFPGIPDWHSFLAKELQSQGCLTNPFGLKRYFWSRLWDDATLREAIAFGPASITAYVTAIGEYKMWKALEGPDFNLLMNGHDSTLIQVRRSKLEEYIPLIKQCIEVKVPVTDIKGKERELIIPTEIMVGMNWGNFDKKEPLKNPEGLKEYKRAA